jgi:hypothetical protein
MKKTIAITTLLLTSLSFVAKAEHITTPVITAEKITFDLPSLVEQKLMIKASLQEFNIQMNKETEAEIKLSIKNENKKLRALMFDKSFI